MFSIARGTELTKKNLTFLFRKDEVEFTQVNGINLMLDAGIGYSYEDDIDQDSCRNAMKVNMRCEATNAMNFKGKR